MIKNFTSGFLDWFIFEWSIFLGEYPDLGVLFWLFLRLLVLKPKKEELDPLGVLEDLSALPIRADMRKFLKLGVE